VSYVRVKFNESHSRLRIGTYLRSFFVDFDYVDFLRPRLDFGGARAVSTVAES